MPSGLNPDATLVPILDDLLGNIESQPCTLDVFLVALVATLKFLEKLRQGLSGGFPVR